MDADRFREFERTAHDRIAASYHAFFVPITEHAAEPLLDAVGVRNGMRMLDIATGSGVVAGHAAARGAVATGVDISSRMVSLATELHPACLFRQADVECLPFPDASFDAVVCAFGIGHFPRAELAVAECERVLLPQGRLAFAWWDAPARNRLHGVLLEAVAQVDAAPPPDLPAGPPMFRYSEDAAFAALLASAGLEQVSVAAHAFHYSIAHADALWDGAMGSLARTAALLRGQTVETQARIRARFDDLAAAYSTPDGLRLPMAFKIASGRKRKRAGSPEEPIMPNRYDVAGKRAIVTGAAKGIGRAIAELLMASGCDVTIWDAHPSHVAGAASLQLDVTHAADVAAAVAELPAGRRVDILVNNAGYLGRATGFVDHLATDWRRIVDVNLVGTMQVTQALLPTMIAQGGIGDSPMGRLGEADEVAQLVAWLCTEASRFNTGAIFDMSGGRARY